MLARAATRTTTSLVTKRGFHATRARLSSPYHYPEGAYSNIPFNPRSKWFGVGYWTFMATGFFAPFGISGACFMARYGEEALSVLGKLLTDYSLANLQAPVSWLR
jgi:cytochrome c oxidase subunit 7c